MRGHIDITGQRFGRLTAIEYLGASKWKCICDCGNVRTVQFSALNSGRSKSCGCLKASRASTPKEDLTGRRFCRLTVESYADGGKWNCLCDCGNRKIADTWSLTHGVTPSCGCRWKEFQGTRNATHGESNTRLYRVWADMRNRCNNKRTNDYKYYGARGIKICPEWASFKVFRDWAMSHGYDPNSKHRSCTLDRIDTDGNYEPSNCRWASHSVQMRNRRPYRNPKLSRAVELLSDEGLVVERYPSIVDASNATGCTQGGIQAVCSGKQKTTSGMRWQYAAD